MTVHRCGNLHIEYDEGGLMVRRPDGAQGQIELTWEDVHTILVVLMRINIKKYLNRGVGEL